MESLKKCCPSYVNCRGISMVSRSFKMGEAAEILQNPLFADLQDHSVMAARLDLLGIMKLKQSPSDEKHAYKPKNVLLGACRNCW